MRGRSFNAALTAALVLVTVLPVAPSGAAGTDLGQTYELNAFTDTASSVFKNAIDWLAAQKITTGCNPPANTRFCPDSPVTRGEMAVFLARALNLPAAKADHFVDDSGAFYEGAANRMYESGITVGCNPPANNRYCGNDRITRDQMATFMVRGFKLSATNVDYFIDDEGNVHEGNINRVRSANVTVGCNPPVSNQFCPKSSVTRGQMSAFIKRAVEWKANPKPPPSGGGGGNQPPPPPPAPCSGTSGALKTDCQTLVALYNSMGGKLTGTSGWEDKDGWLVGNPCSPAWEGITCGNGRVTRIDLGGNGLSGTIPNLSALTALTFLDLSDNDIEDTIPATLGNLPLIQVLDLSNNELVDPIPVELTNLTTLTHLILSTNDLGGGIPPEIASLTALQVLELDSMGLAGGIPDLSALTDLRTLDLSDNDLEGGIPATLGSLTNLQLLDLSSNDSLGELSSIPEELSQLAQLRELDLSDITLTGVIPANLFSNMLSLSEVDLSNNVLAGSIPDSLGNPDKPLFTSLALDGNSLSGLVPLSLIALDTITAGGLRLCPNGGLSATDPTLIDFLNLKHPATDPWTEGC